MIASFAIEAAATAASTARPNLRRKSGRRRLARELRGAGPVLALVALMALMIGTISWIERATAVLDGRDYWPMTSSSSMSNVSAAPPGIEGGAPRSP
jgi:SOS response regulatory protein OraA/RecX